MWMVEIFRFPCQRYKPLTIVHQILIFSKFHRFRTQPKTNITKKGIFAFQRDFE